MTAPFRAGFWRLADPRISLASMASMFLGAAAAARDGALAWGRLAVTVLGIFAIEVAKNASGELVDWDSGTDRAVTPEDRSPFSGGKRVLVDGLLTPYVLWLSFPLGVLIGAFLWINEFPDYRADLATGKRTLVVRLGRRRASVAFAILVGVAFLTLLFEPVVGAPITALFGAAGLVPAARAARTLVAAPGDTPRVVPAQAQTLLAFLLVALGSGVGMLL